MFAQSLYDVTNPCMLHTNNPVLMQAPNSDRTPTIRDKRSTTSYLIVVGNKPPPAARLHPDYLRSSCQKISGGLIAQVFLWCLCVFIHSGCKVSFLHGGLCLCLPFAIINCGLRSRCQCALHPPPLLDQTSALRKPFCESTYQAIV